MKANSKRLNLAEKKNILAIVFWLLSEPNNRLLQLNNYIQYMNNRSIDTNMT